ncbi:MAG TPA: VTT domain-containing protein [Actinotalea sp.]|nr:VTT domain-containing protein [Actinotalea sp.]
MTPTSVLARAASEVLAGPVRTLGPDWLDPATIITTLVDWLGPWAVLGVCAVIFAETGLMVGFFLPGDSLLFTLGMFVGTGVVDMPMWQVLPLLFLSAVLGNTLGYVIGYKAGPAIFDRPDSRLFRREYIDRTHAFFEKHGGKAIVLAQFVPIVRTFTPVAAGVGRMNFRHFISYNILGALLWAVGVTSLGYWLGGFPFVQHNIEYILLGIIAVSVTPMIIEALRNRAEMRRIRVLADLAEPHPDTTSD